MADTQLKSITLRNWTTVRDATLDFPEWGLVVVQGVNLASKGRLASVGSGKSAIGEAISRALFEVRGRYTHLGHYSTNGKGNSLVTVNCLHQGKPLQVELGFKCPEISPAGEGLRFTYDGSQVYRDCLANTRADLARLLTVPAELASWSIHLDGDLLKFNDLSERKAVDLLMAALMQPAWTSLARKANNTAGDLKRDVLAATSAANSARDDFQEAEDDVRLAQSRLQAVQSSYAVAVAENARLLAADQAALTRLAGETAARQKQKTGLNTEIQRRMAHNAEREKAAEIKVNAAREALDDAKAGQADLRSRQSTAAADERHAEAARDRALKAPKACPTCARPWDRTAKLIAENTTALAQSQQAREKADAALHKQAGAVASVQAAFNTVHAAWTALKAEAPIDDLSAQFEALETQDAAADRETRRLERSVTQLQQGPDKNEVSRCTATLQERKARVVKLKQKLGEAAAKTVEHEESLRVVEYWQGAFSPAGIPNLVMRDILPPLNAASRRISARLTGGTLEVTYATSRALVSGAEKSELVIQVKNNQGSVRAEGSSKGEGTLVNLIVAETLAEVGGVAARIGYRFYDEILGSMDEQVRKSILVYLKEIAARAKILVFIVSHTPEALDYADHVLIAEKTVKGTTYAWGG